MQNPAGMMRMMQMFPREFRMTGSISDDITKSNEFLDVCRQVTDGRNKRYSDVEIMSGLRRIVAPGAVKTYIDSNMNMSLDEVLLFLQSFLRVRTPSELNLELTKLGQEDTEKPVEFFMKALKLRQLMYVANLWSGDVSHGPAVVRSTFLHTLRTGLTDDGVRAYMMPYLSESSQCEDNLIIRELHKAEAEAAVRRSKNANNQKNEKKSRNAQVNAVENSPEYLALMKRLDDNQQSIKVMQEQMKEMLKVNPNFQNRPREKGCQKCRDANRGDTCRHCWKCGEDGHRATRCQSN